METSRIVFDHISEYQDITKHHNLLFSRSKGKKKKKHTLKQEHCQEIKELTESEVKMQITHISEINDTTTDPKDTKMIRKYYNNYIYNFDNTIGRY